MYLFLEHQRVSQVQDTTLTLVLTGDNCRGHHTDWLYLVNIKVICWQRDNQVMLGPSRGGSPKIGQDPKMIEILTKMQPPISIKDVRTFLHLVNLSKNIVMIMQYKGRESAPQKCEILLYR